MLIDKVLFFFCAFSAPVDEYALKMSLETGEAVMGWCEKREKSNYTAVAAYAYHLAQLYEMYATTMVDESEREKAQKWNRASRWYSYSASMWQAHSERAYGFASALLASAEYASNAAVASFENERAG